MAQHGYSLEELCGWGTLLVLCMLMMATKNKCRCLFYNLSVQAEIDEIEIALIESANTSTDV